MADIYLEHAERESEPLTNDNNQTESNTFAIGIIVLSLLFGVGLGAAHLHDMEVAQHPTIVVAGAH